jgi:hypothetical protein
LQLLARWDHVHPLPAGESVQKTYFGGSTTEFDATGIEHYIDQSGHFIDVLQSHPVDPKVPVALLAGSKSDIPLWDNETTGPSDGVIFVESALAAARGSNVVARDVLPLNHLELVWNRQGQQWIVDQLLAR